MPFQLKIERMLNTLILGKGEDSYIAHTIICVHFQNVKQQPDEMWQGLN